MLDKLIEIGSKIFGSTTASGSVSKYLKKNPWVGTAASYGLQRRDANRAHRRQMNDLRRAGINPILSAKLGGAQTPTMGDMGQTMNTARQIDNQEHLAKIQEFKTIADVEKAGQDIEESKARVSKYSQEIDTLIADMYSKLASAEHSLTQVEAQQILNDTMNENPVLEDIKNLNGLPLITGAGGLILTALAFTPAGRGTKLALAAKKKLIKHFPNLKKYLDKGPNWHY